MINSKSVSYFPSSQMTTGRNEKNYQDPPSEEKKGLSLRKRLLLGIVPTVLTPLMVAGVAGWSVVHTNIKNQYENRLQEQSLLASQVSQETLSNLLQTNQQIVNQTFLETTKVQVLDTSTKQVLTTITAEGSVTEENTQGGETVETIARSLIEALNSASDPVPDPSHLANPYNLQQTNLQFYNQDSGQRLIFNFLHQGRKYYLTTIPQTDWVAISSVENRVLQGAGNELIYMFVLVGGVLGVVAVGIVVILARQLSSPLINVSQSVQQVAAGNLAVRAQLQGGVETRTLATSFNNLVERVQALLKQQEATSEQQRQQREKLEEEVSQLMNDLEGAAEGDLTVRSRLLEGDVGIVADLFNMVVENLQDTARQVKQAASGVTDALGDNDVEIRKLAQSAIAQAEEIQATLNSVEEMTRSIKEVAQNAQQAANLADQAFSTAQEGNEAMAETVESIQQLRSTVGETAQKMQEMGKSAQQITEVVSIIDQISLKTTLLAMNASLEAHQAGEFGKGFTAVAEQIESLSEQSASAAQEIAQIVKKIQVQTSESIEAMELGHREVLASTQSVEKTKERLSDVVERSETINQIMQSISHSTVSQAETSQAVSRLMEQSARSSQDQSQTSTAVAQAIQETVQVAKTLEASVENFKVEK